MTRRSYRAVRWILALGVLQGCVEPGHVERRWTVMGTYAEVEVYATSRRAAEQTSDAMVEAIGSVDATMSNWKEDSALSRLNRDARIAPVKVEDHDLYRCIKLAREYARRTAGAFDPTVGPLMTLHGFRPPDSRIPTDQEILEARAHVGWEKFEIVDEIRTVRFLDDRLELDLGGIAKGYAVDVAARRFSNAGVIGGLIDLGGSLYAWGRRPDGAPWRVGLRDPQDPDLIIAALELADRAVATSGNYESAFLREGRTVGHIMDAKTGGPARSDVLAATVVADSGVEADALSTAFFAGGSLRAGEILGRSRRIEAVLLVEGASGPIVLASASLKDKLELDPAYVERIGGRLRFILPPMEI